MDVHTLDLIAGQPEPVSVRLRCDYPPRPGLAARIRQVLVDARADTTPRRRIQLEEWAGYLILGAILGGELTVAFVR